MKFFLCFFAIFSICASSSFAVEIKDDYDFSNDLGVAVFLMKQGQTESACEKLEEITSQTSNDNVKFYLSVCYNKMSKPGKAIKELEAMLEKSPEYIRARLELATAYYLNRNYSKAKKAFGEILKREDLPESARKNATTLLGNIEKIKTYGGRISIGGVLDNNVNTGTESNTVSILNLPFELSQDSKPSEDKALTYSFSLYKKLFFNKNLSTNLSYQYSVMDYSKDESEIYDLAVSTIAVSPSLTIGKYGSDLDLRAAKIRLGHSGYSDMYQVSFKNYYNMFNSHVVPEYTIGSKKMDYKLSNSAIYEGDSEFHNVGVKFNIISNNRLMAYILPYYQYEEYKLAKEYTSHKQDRYGVQYVQTLPMKTTFQANYFYTKNNNNDIDSLYNNKRNIKSDTLHASLNKVFDKHYSVGLSYMNINQKSEVELFDYQRERFSLDLTVNF